MGLGSGIPDRGSKRHRIPDPDPQHCFNVYAVYHTVPIVMFLIYFFWREKKKYFLELANMLGPNPPPTPTEKVANIPLLQPPPAHARSHRTSPVVGGPVTRTTSHLQDAAPLSSVAQGGQNSQRPTRPSGSGAASSSARSPDKNKTAHVRPFVQNTARPGIGDIRGASANWRPLTDGRVDLLAGQRQQLKQFDPEARPTANRLDESFGSNHSGASGDIYGRREGNSGARYLITVSFSLLVLNLWANVANS